MTRHIEHTVNDGHNPAPGPLYWNWRCLRCGAAVSDHPNWWQRLRIRMAA